jgi:hypothetical protein
MALSTRRSTRPIAFGWTILPTFRPTISGRRRRAGAEQRVEMIVDSIITLIIDMIIDPSI